MDDKTPPLDLDVEKESAMSVTYQPIDHGRWTSCEVSPSVGTDSSLGSGEKMAVSFLSSNEEWSPIGTPIAVGPGMHQTELKARGGYPVIPWYYRFAAYLWPVPLIFAFAREMYVHFKKVPKVKRSVHATTYAETYPVAKAEGMAAADKIRRDVKPQDPGAAEESLRRSLGDLPDVD